jgi:hypothetical protein
MAEHRAAAARACDKPASRAAAVVIVSIWAACLAVATWWGYRHVTG